MPGLRLFKPTLLAGSVNPAAKGPLCREHKGLAGERGGPEL